MARARNIKASFFTHDKLADNCPLGRLLFIGLWTIADHKGELEWRAKRIKAQILPYDECDIEKLAINLERNGFIRFYSVQGSSYVHIVNFSKHQNPHPNEKKKGSDVPPIAHRDDVDSSQDIDLTDIAINHDKITSETVKIGSAPADSCFLIPDSLSLIPDSGNLIPDETLMSSSSNLDGLEEDYTSEESDRSVAIKTVIEHLNAITGSKYKASTKSHASNISGRLNEGHSVEDLMAVVRFKCQEWLHDPKMAQYLRPETLFQAGKFNGYLTAAKATQGPLAGLSEISRKNAQNLLGDW